MADCHVNKMNRFQENCQEYKYRKYSGEITFVCIADCHLEKKTTRIPRTLSSGSISSTIGRVFEQIPAGSLHVRPYVLTCLRAVEHG
jgi:hypothetical protein